MTKQYQNNIKVLFVCHGNICRSPMAEFIMKDMVEKRRQADRFYIASAATSREEIGNPVSSRNEKQTAPVRYFHRRKTGSADDEGRL